jgi:hypothetical protein
LDRTEVKDAVSVSSQLFPVGRIIRMTRKDRLKIITLITAAAFWTSPDYAAEIGNVRTYKASRVVARPAKAHRSSLQPVDPYKIAWNTGPLILGIGF